MGTPQQNQANYRNSRLSKGPKTPEGKARAAKNALKHGLLSRGVLLPDEDAGAFSELSRCLAEDLNPVGGLEILLVDRIIDLFWRLQRSRKFEAGILAWYRGDIALHRFEERKHQAGLRAIENSRVSPEVKAILDGERDAKQFLQDAKETDLATSGEIYIEDARRTNALANMARYETSLERSLYKALHQLERRQALRQGKDVPVPLAVDIDVSGAAPDALRITAGEEPQAVEDISLERKTPRPIRLAP
jgi:hypothetical protein